MEQIYHDLIEEIPTLSKTTVYNTLNLFERKGLVKLLSLGETETRYDVITELHGHFKCVKCETISNFSIDADSLQSEQLVGYAVHDKNVYFKGLCPKCLLNIKRRKGDEFIL